MQAKGVGRDIVPSSPWAVWRRWPPAWLASGLLCGSAYLFIPASPLPLLAWVGLVPLLLRLETVDGFWRFHGQGLAMVWVMESMALGRVFAIDPAWSLLVVTGQGLVTSGVFAALWLLRRKLGWRRAVLFLPACWTAWEWLYAKQPLQIPTFLGSTQADFYPLIQFYDVTGVWGGTFLIVLCNVLLAAVFSHGRASGKSWGYFARVAAMVMGVVMLPPLAYSAWVFSAEEERPEAGRVRVALTQTGDPATLGVAVARKSAELSEGALEAKPDLLLWPESSLERDVHSAGSLKLWKSLHAWVAGAGVPVLTGMVDVEKRPGPAHPFARWDGGKETYNAATLITPQLAYYTIDRPAEEALNVKVYRKRELFPFGERVPFLSVFPGLYPLAMHAPGQPPRNMGYGGSPEVFAFLSRDGVKRRVGAFICYEILFPHIAADLARNGAAFLVTVSNDQHLRRDARWVTAAHARIRAIETRRAMARANTVGYSLFVDPYGRTQDIAPLDVPGIVIHAMDMKTALSPYVRWGDWLPLACSLAVAGLLLGLAFKPAAA